MKAFFILLSLCVGLNAQISQEVTQGEGSPGAAFTQLFFRDGSNNLQYLCRAYSNQPAYNWYWTAKTGSGVISTISVTSNVATITMSANHGLKSGNRVYLTAATTANLGGSYIATVTGATTFTIPTSGVSDGSYTNITDPNLTVYTNAPRTTAGIWSIYYQTWTTSYQNTKQWVEGSTAYNYICDNKATYAYN